MKKLIVAVLIIGTFVMYSFTHRQPNSAALVSPPAVDSGTVASLVTPASAAGASNTPPASTAASAAASATHTPAPPDPTPRSAPVIVPTPTSSSGGTYKDGSYTGSVADAQWGYIQVRAIITAGKVSDVQFLQYPNDRSRSVRINQYADPVLKSEAIQAQSAQVDIITGATDSSEAFIQSLSDALSQAQS